MREQDRTPVDGLNIGGASVAAAQTISGDPQPLADKRNPFVRAIAPLLTIGVVIGVVYQLQKLNLAQIQHAIPTNPLFWLLFALYYASGPVSDWVIFRRLWGLPVSGLIALVRKLVANEIVIGYAGEVYFYSWARTRLNMKTSPFGAVKDVAILSALTGNAVTLVMLCIAWPLFGSLNLNIPIGKWLLSIGTVIAILLLVTVFSRRVFSLSRRELWFVAWAHFGRITISTILAGLAWAVALPIVHFSLWVVLATIRLLVSRLPFVTNKDALFALIAVFFVGHDSEITALMLLWATLIMATHIALGAVLVAGDLILGRERT